MTAPKKRPKKPKQVPAPAPPAPEPPDPFCCPATAWKSRVVSWWDPGRIAYGGVTMLDGDPSSGKTMLLCWLAAQVSRGRSPHVQLSLFGQNHRGVLMITESPVEHVVLPRLEAMGAALDRIHFWGRTPGFAYSPPQLPFCLADLQKSIVRHQVGLVVFDTISSSMTKVGTTGDAEVRSCLDPLNGVCQQTGVMCVCTRHLTKMSGVTAMYRGLGGMGIVGASQTALLITRQPGDPSKRVLSLTKSNLPEEALPRAFRIDSDQAGKLEIVWGEELDTDSTELLAGEEEAGRRDALADAQRLLREILATDAKPCKQVLAEAETMGVKERTLRTAKAKLRVDSDRRYESGEAVWYWCPPKGGWPSAPESLDDPGMPPDNE